MFLILFKLLCHFFKDQHKNSSTASSSNSRGDEVWCWTELRDEQQLWWKKEEVQLKLDLCVYGMCVCLCVCSLVCCLKQDFITNNYILIPCPLLKLSIIATRFYFISRNYFPTLSNWFWFWNPAEQFYFPKPTRKWPKCSFNMAPWLGATKVFFRFVVVCKNCIC